MIIVAVILVAVFIMRQPAGTTVPVATTSVEEEGEADQLNIEVPTPTPDATTTSPAAAVSPTPSAIEATASANTVTISDTGFTPATLTVPVNTTVTFTNNGQGAHWPASAPHPTHTGLPGFDAERGLATGESYSYTFTKVGTWPYHDHLNPRLFGSITVE